MSISQRKRNEHEILVLRKTRWFSTKHAYLFRQNFVRYEFFDLFSFDIFFIGVCFSTFSFRQLFCRHFFFRWFRIQSLPAIWYFLRWVRASLIEFHGSNPWKMPEKMEFWGRCAINTLSFTIFRKPFTGKVVENEKLGRLDSFAKRWDLLLRWENYRERVGIGVNRVSEKRTCFRRCSVLKLLVLSFFVFS